MVGKKDKKWAERRLSLILSVWEEDHPTLSLFQLINKLGCDKFDDVHLDIRGNKCLEVSHE